MAHRAFCRGASLPSFPRRRESRGRLLEPTRLFDTPMDSRLRGNDEGKGRKLNPENQMKRKFERAFHLHSQAQKAGKV